MRNLIEHHKSLTVARAKAFQELFGTEPCQVFPFHQFSTAETICIDVFVYPLEVADVPGPVVVAVTNGMSDFRMEDHDRPEAPCRRELLQYFSACSDSYARRLHDAAWLPHVDHFLLDEHDTITWPDPLADDLQHSFFLRPIWNPHAEFVLDIESDEVSFLWHIPVTDAELSYKKSRGPEALIDRMEQANLPWLFDPKTRVKLVGRKKR